MNKQLELRRLADVTINIYAAAAVISRASASVKAVNRNPEASLSDLTRVSEELRLARAFLTHATSTNDTILRQLERPMASILLSGRSTTFDSDIKHISDHSCRKGGYFPTHPMGL